MLTLKFTVRKHNNIHRVDVHTISCFLTMFVFILVAFKQGKLPRVISNLELLKESDNNLETGSLLIFVLSKLILLVLNNWNVSIVSDILKFS